MICSSLGCFAFQPNSRCAATKQPAANAPPHHAGAIHETQQTTPGQSIRCGNGSGGRLIISFGPRQGDFAPWWKQIDVVVHDRSPAATIASSNLRVSKSTKGGTALEFQLPDAPAGGEIIVGR